MFVIAGEMKIYWLHFCYLFSIKLKGKLNKMGYVFC